MDGFEAALDAYTMPQQRLRHAALDPLRHHPLRDAPQPAPLKDARPSAGPRGTAQPETSAARFVKHMLGPRPAAAAKKPLTYVEKPGGVHDQSALFMHERQQRGHLRAKQAELEELLFAINAQSIQHEALAREKKLPISSEPHDQLAATNAQKWMAVRCEETDRLLIDATSLVKQSRESRKSQRTELVSADDSQRLFPSRGGQEELRSLCGSMLMRPQDGRSSIDSADGEFTAQRQHHQAFPVTEWCSAAPPSQLLSPLDGVGNTSSAAVAWNTSTAVVDLTSSVRKVPLLVPGEVEDAPATDVDEVLRAIHTGGIAAAQPRSFVSMVVCALHTYGGSLARSQRLQAVGPLLKQVKIPPRRKSFRDILLEKRMAEAEAAAASAGGTATTPLPIDPPLPAKQRPTPVKVATPVRRSTPTVRQAATPSKSPDAASMKPPCSTTIRDSGSMKPLLPLVCKHGNPKPMRLSDVRTTTDLFEALAAQTEGGRTRHSDEQSYAHSDLGTLGWRSAGGTPDGREEPELTSFLTLSPVERGRSPPLPELSPDPANATGATQAGAAPPAAEDPATTESLERSLPRTLPEPEATVAAAAPQQHASTDKPQTPDEHSSNARGRGDPETQAGTAAVVEVVAEPSPVTNPKAVAEDPHSTEGISTSHPPSETYEDDRPADDEPGYDEPDYDEPQGDAAGNVPTASDQSCATTTDTQRSIDEVAAATPATADAFGHPIDAAAAPSVPADDDDDGYGSSDFEATSPERGAGRDAPQPHAAPTEELPTEREATPAPVVPASAAAVPEATVPAPAMPAKSASPTGPADTAAPLAVQTPADGDDYDDDNDFDAESPKNEDDARRVAQLKAELRVAGDDNDGEDDLYSDDGFDEGSPHHAGKDPAASDTAAEGDAYASQLSAALKKLKKGGGTPPPDVAPAVVAPPPVLLDDPMAPNVAVSPPRSADPRPDSQRRGARTSRHGTGTKTAIQYTARDFFGTAGATAPDGGPGTASGGYDTTQDVDQNARPTSRASVSTGDHRTGPVSPVSESWPDSSRVHRGGKERVVSLEMSNFEEIDMNAFPSKKSKKSKRKTSDVAKDASSGSTTGSKGSRKQSSSQGLDL